MPVRHLALFFTILLGFSFGTTSESFGQVPNVSEIPFHAPQVEGAQPLPAPSPIQQVAGPVNVAMGQVQPAGGAAAAAASETVAAGTVDPVLGTRLARISTTLREIPNKHGQIWREFDITPYTKGRAFPATSNPSQTVVDWILRQTGAKLWHTAPFGILTADENNLYVYHTKEVQLLVADIVDRFINPQTVNESYTVRVVALSRPDWITKGHTYLRPIPIRSPGVQGWILEKEGTQLLFQELSQRNDFTELSPPQFYIPNGIAHNVESRKQRTYLRDVQANPSALNGYAEDRVTIDEGFGVSFIPLAGLDGQTVDAMIKLDITLIEKMIPLMIDAPTQANPRQRIQIESPQVACFQLDEQIRWPKSKVLLLDLGTVPVPGQQPTSEATNIFANMKKLGQPTSRANVLLFIEQIGNTASPIISNPSSSPTIIVNGQPQNGVVQSPAIGASSPYWQGIR